MRGAKWVSLLLELELLLGLERGLLRERRWPHTRYNMPGFGPGGAGVMAVPNGPMRRVDTNVFRALWRLWRHALDNRA
jgi:hypothetical protein